MNENAKRVLSTYVEPALYRQVAEEAQRKQVSIAAVVRWALLNWYGPYDPAESPKEVQADSNIRG